MVAKKKNVVKKPVRKSKAAKKPVRKSKAAKKPVRKSKATKKPVGKTKLKTKDFGELAEAPTALGPEEEIDNVSYYDGTTAAELVEARGWHLGGHKQTAFIYMYRAGNKPGQPVERDLKKAQWYLNRLAEVEGPSILEDAEFVELMEMLEAAAGEHNVTLVPLHETVWLPPLVVEEKVLIDDSDMTPREPWGYEGCDIPF